MKLKNECVFWLTILFSVTSCLNNFTPSTSSDCTCWPDTYNREEFVLQNCLESNTETLTDILASCSNFSDSKIKSITLFWTREVNRKVFQAQHFANLSSVLHLDFDDPYESDFAPNTFEGLPNLYRFVFKTSSTMLPESLLSWASNLTIFMIEARLSGLKIFKNAKIEKVLIDVKRSEENEMFPDNLFTNLGNVERLDITSEKPLGIPQSRFIGSLKLLERVKIQTHVSKIYNETFYGLENIKNINLSSNSLTRVQNDWFLSQVNLKELHLDHNNISYIEIGSFHNNQKLELLDLSHNHINEISHYILVGLQGLKQLYLEHNNIEFIHPGSFKGTSVLNIYENRLPDKPTRPKSIMFYNKNLELIDLSYNNFSAVFLPDEYFSNDLRVDLSNNNIFWINIDYLDTQSRSHDLSPFFLKLSNNPIDCNMCDVVNLENFRKNKKNLIRLEMDNLTCAQPTTLKGRLVTTLRKEEMLCPLGEIACPPGCKCLYLHQEQYPRLEFNCSNLGLIEAPRIPEVYSVCPTGCHCKFLNSEYGLIFEYSVDCTTNKQALASLNDTNLQCPEGCSCMNFNDYKCNLNFSQKNGSPLQYCPPSCQCDFQQNIDKKTVKVLCDEPEVKELPTLSGLFASNCTRRMLQQSHLLFLHCSTLGRNIILNFGQPDLSIELDLSYNKLTVFPTMKKGGYQNLSKLVLTGNQLDSLDGNDISKDLVSLKLDQNKFQRIDKQVMSRLEGLQELYLGSNDWKCDCSETELYNFTLALLKKKIQTDFIRMNCSNGVPLMDLKRYCDKKKNMLRVLLAIAAGLTIAMCTILCALKSQRIKIYIYSKGWFWYSEDDLDSDKIYDAFISYSHVDEVFVEETLVPRLESGDHPYKICVHVRDWELGAQITTQIRKSVDQSRKTIIVLSTGFLQSCWAMAEFRLAHKNASNEGRINGVFAILMEDKRVIEAAGGKEIRAYVNTNTYLHRDDPRFWEKLRVALRHPLSARKKNKDINEETSKDISETTL